MQIDICICLNKMLLETKKKLIKRWEGCDDRHVKLQRRGQLITYPQKARRMVKEHRCPPHHPTTKPIAKFPSPKTRHYIDELGYPPRGSACLSGGPKHNYFKHLRSRRSTAQIQGRVNAILCYSKPSLN